jgi:flagellar secretion chaperone FliS
MFAWPNSNARSTAGLYHTVQVDTGVSGASPHRLVEMLFEEFIASCSRARGAMHSGDVQAKGRAIARAVRIVEEGLRAGLNREQGGTLAHDLHELYGYVTVRLTQANLRNDESAVAECAALIQPLYDAWRAIAPQAADPKSH